MIRTHDVEQDSPEWHDARRGIVTASAVGKLLTPKLEVADNDTSRALTRLLVAERNTGNTDPTYLSWDMERGNFDEPIARDVYKAHYKVDVREVGFITRDDWGFTIGYSPDGLVGDVGAIEIKSRLQKTHLETILTDTVPPENLAQCYCGLLVSNRQWVDYVSYCSGMPLYVKRLYRSDLWDAAIVRAVERFEANAKRMVFDYHAAVTGFAPTVRAPQLEEGIRF